MYDAFEAATSQPPVDPFSIGVNVGGPAAEAAGRGSRLVVPPPVPQPVVGSPPMASSRMSSGPTTAPTPVPPLAPPPPGPTSAGASVTLDDLLGPMPVPVPVPASQNFGAGAVSDPFAVGSVGAGASSLPADPFAASPPPTTNRVGSPVGTGSSTNPFGPAGGDTGFGTMPPPPPPPPGLGQDANAANMMNPLFDIDEGVRDMSLGVELRAMAFEDRPGGGNVGMGGGGGGVTMGGAHGAGPATASGVHDPFECLTQGGGASTSAAVPLSPPPTNPFLSVAPSSQQQQGAR